MSVFFSPMPVTTRRPSPLQLRGCAPSHAPLPQAEEGWNQKLNERNGRSLDRRTSIVGLMKLMGINPSRDKRKELTRKLGYIGELNGGAEMNLWLHNATMREPAKNGGRVPASTMDRPSGERRDPTLPAMSRLELRCMVRSACGGLRKGRLPIEKSR